ncbi:MAG: hypothetical protein U0324_20650 [Polyangiales bacterium]
MRHAVVALALAFGLHASSPRADDVPAAAYRQATEGRFDEAAATLEQEAAGARDAARANALRELALTYRVALGDFALAWRNAQALTGDPERAAEAELEAAEVLTRARRWAEGARFHAAWLRRHGRASAGLRGRALVALGDALRESGNVSAAEAAYRRAAALTRPGEPQEAWSAAARFWVAEAAHRAFMARRMPTFRGVTRRAYDVWVQRELTPFIQEQIRLLRGDLTRAYTEVVNHHAPRWEVAAYQRLASMFYRFHVYVRSAPLPPEFVRHPELMEAYESLICRDPQDGVLDVATEGYRRCLHVATRLREANEFSRACEAELHAIDPGRFPLADEIAPLSDQGL